MGIQSKSDFLLTQLNSFHITARCRQYYEVQSFKQLSEILGQIAAPWMVLGGGSNILFKGDYEGSILKMEIKGKEIIEEDDHKVKVKIGAGESWHALVLWAVVNNYGGIENLALIPGSVGAAPIQNIGAYGVEIKDVFDHLVCFDTHTKDQVIFHNSECKFAYRNSIFKNEAKGRYIITSVVLNLTKAPHQVNTSYKALADFLREKNCEQPSIKDIKDAVIAVRQSKLPDPDEIGNCGSFFKNPIITKHQYDKLLKEYSKMPSYPVDENTVKVPAAWLIDQCGWKGKRFGDAGVYPKQALVLVNYGNASGVELVALSKKIQKSVLEKYGIALSPEVNII